MDGGRLLKRNVSRNLEGAVRRGRSGEENEWVDRLQSDVCAFGMESGWKRTTLEAEAWNATAIERVARFMVA